MAVRDGVVGLGLLLAACDPVVPWEEHTDLPAAPEETDAYRPDTGAAVDTDAPAADDEDGDGVPDPDDNCRAVANPDQADADVDASGDVCDDERDGDEIPNTRDLFPDDPERPGVASLDHVYAHGPSELWRMDVPTYGLERLGPFTFDQRAGQVTDIAIDRYGVLYATTFYDAFVCHPTTAACWWIGHLPGSYNGLTFVPDDTGQIDVLLGVAINGTWTAYPDVPFGFTPQSWGGYGAGYTSSGDAFHVRGTGTFAAVNAGEPSVHVLEVDTHGRPVRDLVTLTGHYGVYGIAGAANRIFAFSSNGAVLEIDPSKDAFARVAQGISWWGAGVRTIVVP